MSSTLPSRALAIAEYRLRPLRRALAPHRRNRNTRTLGPVNVHGHHVVLRPPRMADAAEWSALRMRDRAILEPFWVTSELSWERQHSEHEWIGHIIRMRIDERSGTGIYFALSVDGQFSGQCDLLHIDTAARTAEIGLWMSSELAHEGIASDTATLFLDFVFGELGIRRLAAAICVDNVPARHLALRAGLEYEGTMADYLDVGGRRRDHDLWAITEPMWRADHDLRASTPADIADGPAHGGYRTSSAMESNDLLPESI
ncbi:GNAT family N-acetyltransferase [Rhodococcus sp. NPDC060090]|uniref:GNAT family N-acetyltransferase n=1 Tax=Rhodococcus sp. NPDC060090 TaxID=3347056 RepID=UPI00364E1040